MTSSNELPQTAPAPAFRDELISAVANIVGSKKDAARIVTVVFETTAARLRRENRVQLYGFGSFAATHVEPRIVRNPATGENVQADATVRVTFRPARALHDFLTGATSTYRLTKRPTS